MIKWHFYKAWMVLELGYLLQRFPGNQAIFSFISHVHESEESSEIHQRLNNLFVLFCYDLMISELWFQVIEICLGMSSSRADHCRTETRQHV